MTSEPNDVETNERRAWMATLAKAEVAELEAALTLVVSPPKWRWLRKPETGLAMVRGRAGGSGKVFNLGEVTVTRCALVTDTGFQGHAYVTGRSTRQAELAALFDALLQDRNRRRELSDSVLRPLAAKRAVEKARKARKVAGTKVDFYTLVRGED